MKLKTILDKLNSLVERGMSDNFDNASKSVKEVIEWLTKANDSAVRIGDKLKEYKENVRTRS